MPPFMRRNEILVPIAQGESRARVSSVPRSTPAMAGSVP